jgi:hypothetical protein
LKKLRLFLIFVVAALAMVSRVDGQINEFNGHSLEKASPTNCEDNAVEIESQAKNIIDKLKTENGLLILISFLGSDEKNRTMSQRRLFNLKTRLQNLGVPEQKIIIAEGQRVKGYGKVISYFNGKPVGFLVVPKNKDVCVACCGPDERFYPYKAKSYSVRKSIKRR